MGLFSVKLSVSHGHKCLHGFAVSEVHVVCVSSSFKMTPPILSAGRTDLCCFPQLYSPLILLSFGWIYR